MMQKFAIWAPSHNFVGLYLRNWGMCQQSEKNLLSSNISSTCPPGAVLNITAAVWNAGFHWWRSGNKKRTQNVSEYMLVLALCLVYFMLSVPVQLIAREDSPQNDLLCVKKAPAHSLPYCQFFSVYYHIVWHFHWSSALCGYRGCK